MAQDSALVATSGVFGTADLFVEQRKYDKDKSKRFVWRERGHAPLVHFLVTKIPKVAVTDPEPRHFEDGYFPTEFALTADSGGGTSENIFTVSESSAAYIQPGDTFVVRGIFCNINTATSTVTYGTRSATYSVEEVVEVLSKAAPSGGNVDLTVRRGVGGDTVTSPPNVPSGTKLTYTGPASAEGADARTSISQNPDYVENYIQDFRHSYEVTDFVTATDIYVEEEMQRKARNARMNFIRTIARAFLKGIKYRRKDSRNQWIRFTGGIDSFIPNDSDHRVDAGGSPITQSWLNDAFADAMMVGSSEKIALVGNKFMVDLANSAGGQIYYNDALSQDLGYNFSTFTVTGGGLIHFAMDYEMSKMGMEKEVRVIDAKYLNYMYLKGLDIHINKGPNGKGIQGNGETLIRHEIRGAIGLKRQFAESHFDYHGFA